MRIHHLFYAAVLGLAIAAPSAAQTAHRHRHVEGVVRDAGADLSGRNRAQAGRREAHRQSLSDSQGYHLRIDPGNNLSFTFQTPNPGGDGSILSIGVKCTLDKDALPGEFTVNDGAGGTFSAAAGYGGARQDRGRRAGAIGRQSRSHRHWALSVDFGTISATPSAVFKQEGETLTGQYTSQQYGTFPLKGTVKGNQLSFTFTMTIEGNAIDVLFSGTADKDAIKGSVNYGGIGEGTFSGTRKK